MHVFLRAVLCFVAIAGPLLPGPTRAATSDANTPAQEEPDRRGLPAPLASPPFPGADWVGNFVGSRDTTALWPFEHFVLRDTLAAAGIRVAAWVDVGANYSTSKHSNIPLSYALVPNAVELDQAILRIERILDTVQTDHIDWGFRLSNLFGIDYRYTMAKGYLSDQLLVHNNLYGYDPVEIQFQLYIPTVAEGLILKMGRFISPPDIEAQLAPDNYLYTHSIMFTFDPYTFTGVQATIRFNERWHLALGLHAGNDMAPWSDSAQLNGEMLVRWVSADNDDAVWAGLDSIGAGKFKNGHDDLQVLVATWGHRFNDHVHMMTEAYYIWQFDAALGGTCIMGPSESFASGGGCGPILPGLSSAVGAVNYFQILTTPGSYVSIRNDLLDDINGQRTAFATLYTSHTVGFIYEFTDWLLVRPEARYEHAWTKNATPYDNGTKRQQFTLSGDVIVRF